MRFRSLAGLTSLPLERIRRQFRNEDVRAVLPARSEESATESLLVATATGLAIVSSAGGSADEGWMTRWAPWGAVRLSDDEGPFADSGDRFHLGVLVDRTRFDIELPGDAGRRAMRDFVAVAEERRNDVLTRR